MHNTHYTTAQKGVMHTGKEGTVQNHTETTQHTLTLFATQKIRLAIQTESFSKHHKNIHHQNTLIFTTRSPLHAAAHHRFIHSPSTTTNMYSPAQTRRELNSENAEQAAQVEIWNLSQDPDIFKSFSPPPLHIPGLLCVFYFSTQVPLYFLQPTL